MAGRKRPPKQVRFTLGPFCSVTCQQCGGTHRLFRSIDVNAFLPSSAMFRSIAVTRSIAQVQRRAYSAQSSVAELRKEAKARGVSAYVPPPLRLVQCVFTLPTCRSGSKATILRRLQDSESSTQRRMSTNTTPTTTKPALTPGIPRTPEVQIETERKGHNYLFDVNIPEIQAEAQPTAKIVRFFYLPSSSSANIREITAQFARQL